MGDSESGEPAPKKRRGRTAIPAKLRERKSEARVSSGKQLARRRGNPRFTDKQIAEALIAAGGIQADAAALLAQASGKPCTRSMVTQAVYRNPGLQKVIEQTKEVKLDLGESKLMQRVEAGDTNAIRFFLETQGKSRGYGRRTEVDSTINLHITKEAMDNAKSELLLKYERLAAAKEIEGTCEPVDTVH